MGPLFPHSSPVERSSSAARWVWAALLALSPLAYLGGLWLYTRLPARVSTQTISRQKAIEIASRFADSRVGHATAWQYALGTIKHDQASVLLGAVRAPSLDKLAAGSDFRVLLQSPTGDAWLHVDVAPNGSVVGFEEMEPNSPASFSEAESRAAAERFLTAFLGGASPFRLTGPKTRPASKNSKFFVWRAPVPEAPKATLLFNVRVAGDRVTSYSSDVTIDADYWKVLRPARALQIALKFGAFFYVIVLGIYAIVRYARRSSEKEISHRRTLLVAALVLACFSVVVFSGAVDASLSVNGTPPSGAQRFVMLLIVLVVFATVAAFYGVAYGAGEGDVRAAYPGKLTSLDALLSGKLFSRNVAQSVLAGGAFAGFMLLLNNAALLAGGGVRPLDFHALIASLAMRFPVFDAFSDSMMNALGVPAFGVLLPIAFLRPRVRKEWVFYSMLPLVSLLSVSQFLSDFASWRNFAVSTAVAVATTCVPFFFGDLLASIAGVAALTFVSEVIQRATASQEWRGIALAAAPVGVAFLAAEAYYAVRGRWYEDREVRPVYARNLAEHLSMQAEIGAAREAQMWLMPDAPPRIAGMTIAGSCVPSREVGGDFFDFYALDDHRLGVFVAEGGERELGPAMTIALAKGYLLHATRLELAPVEVLRSLRAQLEATFHGDHADVSMFYAVIDSSARTVRFARTGNSPRMVINGHEAAEEIPAAGAAMAARHGTAALNPNDALVFYTDGLEAQIAARKRQPANRFLEKVVRDVRSGSAADVHAAILDAAFRRRHESPPDDVTAVVVRLDRAERVLEVVA